MENIELQQIWRSFDKEINQKSKAELNLLLTSKAKQTINKFLIVSFISILSSVGFITFLIIASLNRQNDIIYLINNVSVGLISIIGLSSALLSWYKLQNNKLNLSVKNCLELRINLLSKWLTGKYSRLYIILIPLMYVLTVLSIHVYFEYKLFLEVLRTEESVIGLIIGTPIGLFVSYYTVSKIRKYQLYNLEFLKDLYGRLCNVY